MIFSDFDLSTFNALSYCIFYDDEFWHFCKSEYPDEFRIEMDNLRYMGSEPTLRKHGKYKNFKGSSIEKRITEWYKENIDDVLLKVSLNAFELNPNSPRMIPHRDMPTQNLSMLCHLNDNWDESHGGQTLIYDLNTVSNEYTKTMDLSDEYEKSLKGKPFDRLNELEQRWRDLKYEKNIPTATYQSIVMDKQIISVGEAWHGSAPVSKHALEPRRNAYLYFITEPKMNLMKCSDTNQSRLY